MESVMDDDLLKKVQRVELNILIEFDKICRDEMIEYTLAYGTLLGAIRHGGFIPWDDDIDVIVRRDHYERLMEVLSKRLPKHLWLQNYETDTQYYQDFAKIRDTRTVFKVEQQENIDDSKCGVWIDIFPYDFCDKSFLYVIRNKLLKTVDLSIMNRIFGITKCSRRYIIPLFVWRLFPLDQLKHLQKRLMVGNGKARKYVTHMTAQPPQGICKFMIPTEWLESCETTFEGFSFKIPQQYDVVLNHFFGDYMKLPPENERKKHTAIKLIIPDSVC